MGDNLTKRQREILDYISDFSEDNGYAPSIREIGEKFNLSSPATVHAHVENLKKKGFLKTSFNEARSIEITSREINWAQAIELPLAGLITAGEPIEAVEDNEQFTVPADMAGGGDDTFVLKVKGDSMIEDGILSGDYVVVEKSNNPQNGDIVVALIDNAYATLKRFYREMKRVRLQPANSTMDPIYVDNPVIQGIVKGVIRKFK